MISHQKRLWRDTTLLTLNAQENREEKDGERRRAGSKALGGSVFSLEDNWLPKRGGIVCRMRKEAFLNRGHY